MSALSELKTTDEVVNEVLESVTHLEPFFSRTHTVSSAFCLLFKLWTLRVTVNQMTRILSFEGCPFVRCLGFLYLRYTYPPEKLIEWFEDYLDDPEEVKVDELGTQTTTVGAFVRRLLTEKKYYSTMLPPIPIKVQKAIEAALEARKPAKPSSDRKRSRSRSRERRRSRTPTRRRSRTPERRRSRSPERRRSRSRSRDRYRDRSRSRDRHRSRSRDRRRSRSRSRDRHRSRSRDRYRSRSRSRDRRSAYYDRR